MVGIKNRKALVGAVSVPSGAEGGGSGGGRGLPCPSSPTAKGSPSPLPRLLSSPRLGLAAPLLGPRGWLLGAGPWLRARQTERCCTPGKFYWVGGKRSRRRKERPGLGWREAGSRNSSFQTPTKAGAFAAMRRQAPVAVLEVTRHQPGPRGTSAPPPALDPGGFCMSLICGGVVGS